MLLPYSAGLLFAYLHQSTGGIVELVVSLALHEHHVRPEGLEVCVVRVGEYTDQHRSPLVDDTMRSLVRMLEASYPVTITSHQKYVLVYRRREASLVLLDASGFGTEFPAELLLKRFELHECYSKASKFVTLVDASSNVTQAADLFAKLGIVNYLVIPLGAARNGTELAVGALYTRNQFSHREYRFDLGATNTPRSVGHYFPDKLRDVHGYAFFLYGMFVFPYLIDLQRNDRTAGLLKEALRDLIVHRLNGTLEVAFNGRLPAGRVEFDVKFAYTDYRAHFMHDITLLERGGNCLLCPFRTERDFMSHLLKPFSPGIWLVLGTVLLACRLLGRLLPTHFHGALVEQIFFGSGVPHLQPFPTRIVAFAVAVLIFFLSEAYNAKIISLMSLAKYYERPETLQELSRSEMRVANPGFSSSLLAVQLPGKVISQRLADRLYAERGEMLYADFCTMTQCHMALLYASDLEGTRGYLQYVMREQVLENLLTLQLATHSPFHATFADFLLWHFESGLWMYRLEELRNGLVVMIERMNAPFMQVVFSFADLICIWVLIVVGWLVSFGCFVGELMVASLAQAMRGRWRKK